MSWRTVAGSAWWLLVVLVPLAWYGMARLRCTVVRRGRLTRLGTAGDGPSRLRSVRAVPVSSGAVWITHPVLTPLAVAVVAGGVGGWLSGPVAALLACGYLAALTRAALVRRRSRQQTADAVRAMDAVATLAAQLRAGLPVRATCQAVAEEPAVSGVDAELTRARVAAAWSVAECTGAPLADLFDRLDADLRGLARLRATAAANASGIRATAVLLAILPVAGVGAGVAIGAHPLQVMLHTRAGAACAVSALMLQLAGLAWTGRLIRAAEQAR